MTDELDQNRQMPQILLATCANLPDGEPCGDLVTAALARRGLDAAWVVWDDPTVDWSSADVVAVRSTWDYHRRTPEFLAWARDVESRTLLLNGADVFAWNADKGYLADLDLPHVPTMLLDEPSGLAEATARWGSCVVKPRVGASGVGVVVVDGPGHEPALGPARGWSSRWSSRCARSARPRSSSSAAGPPPRSTSVRAATRCGSTRSTAGAPSPCRWIRSAPRWRSRRSPRWVSGSARAPAYARIDVMRWEDAWVVSELELIEPGLYLDIDPTPAEPFAELVASLQWERSHQGS